MTENAPATTTNYFGQVIGPGTIVAVNVLQHRTTTLRLGVVASIGKSGKTAHVHWVFSRRGANGRSEWSRTEKSNVPIVKLIRPDLSGIDPEIAYAIASKHQELMHTGDADDA
ncbi:hypothetical protein SEA_OCTOBIEN14_119 [Gordonia phage Octobien14]|uniref:Uncharacterized protein n=1 Tax=Gordonia phage Octobien14 TaxID=2483673 RepID=A0A3G3M9V7_9CAUD|nr:hypothetical protein L3Y22_gp125 [Gordonia phage Octobien14]AYR03256.1 hypothetical protein SEA_OCTOBIEN14_119 [Gordonia phage Octobien14]